MIQLTKVINYGRKFLIALDVFYSVIDGEYSSFFKSCVAFLGRSNVNILIDDWIGAPMNVKNSI